MIKKSLHMMIHFRCKSRLFVLGTSSCNALSNVLSKPSESEGNRFTSEVAIFYSGKQIFVCVDHLGINTNKPEMATV